MSAKAILVHLGLGSNLGDRKEFLSMACNYLSSEVITGFRASSIYESEPLLKMKQSKYFNMVVCGLTVLSPQEMLKKCQQIEINLGRIRRERWGCREIDIDILSYGSRIIDIDDLVIPHPETGITIKELWENWLIKYEGQDPLPVNTIDKSS